MGELVVHFEDGKIETFECASKEERVLLLVELVDGDRGYDRWVFWRRTAQDGSTVEESV